jgi:hypothetical protein
MTGNDGIGVAGALAEGGFFEVKSQAAFAHFGIWTVATEAIAGEYRLNVLIEIEMRARGVTGLRMTAAGERHEDQNSKRGRERNASVEARACLQSRTKVPTGGSYDPECWKEPCQLQTLLGWMPGLELFFRAGFLRAYRIALR